MNNETQLGFIHRFIPSNKNQAGAKGKIRPTTILLLHGTGGNEEDTYYDPFTPWYWRK